MAYGTIVECAAIYGYNNSTSEKCAYVYDRKFVSLDKTPTITTSTTTTVPDDYSFKCNIDNWDCLNSSSYFTYYNYYLSSSYPDVLRSNLTNTV